MPASVAVRAWFAIETTRRGAILRDAESPFLARDIRAVHEVIVLLDETRKGALTHEMARREVEHRDHPNRQFMSIECLWPQRVHRFHALAEEAIEPVPRIDSWNGLIFGSFDPDIESLDDYLGVMKLFLDAFFGRFPEGIQFVGAPQKWIIDTNWKLPMENQLGDVNHGPFLHAAVIPPETNQEQGSQSLPSRGMARRFGTCPKTPWLRAWVGASREWLH